MPPVAFCASGASPADCGMTAMYLLMSLFHLSPWLKLASGRPSGRPTDNLRRLNMNHAIVSREEWLDARKALSPRNAT